MRLELRWLAFCAVLLLGICSLRAQLAAPATQPALAAPSTQPASSSQLTFFTMGDWGYKNPPNAAQNAVARQMADYAAQLPHPLDGVLIVGDNFYMKLPGGVNDPAWQAVFEREYDPVRLNAPFYVALGNHDYLDGKDAIELDYAKLHPDSRFKLPARWYRLDLPVDHPLVTVLMLDSDKDPLGADRWQQQKQWMDAELSKPRAAWTICCAHHPLFSNGGHGDNGLLQQEWGPIFDKHKVDLYICGHDHDLQHLQIKNWWTSFLLVGGGGADMKLLRHDDRGPMSRLIQGFACMSFTATSLDVKYIAFNGKTLHEFTRDRATGAVQVLTNGGNDKAAMNPLRALEGLGGYNPPATQGDNAKK